MKKKEEIVISVFIFLFMIIAIIILIGAAHALYRDISCFQNPDEYRCKIRQSLEVKK